MGKGKSYFPGRVFMVLGTFLLSLLLYIDRVCISVAKEPIAGELLLTDKQMGWVLSVFALGYALFQTPSGMLADRFGPRKILASIVTIWSFFTALTGMVWNLSPCWWYACFSGPGRQGPFRECRGPFIRGFP